MKTSTRIDEYCALYKDQKITLARAARSLKITRLAMQKELANRGICIHYSVEDVATLKRLSHKFSRMN